MTKWILTAFVVFSITACAQLQRTSEKQPEATVVSQSTPQSFPTKAQAVLKVSGKSKIKGIVHFTEEGESIKIETMVDGLKPGPHGFHIHEVGDCSKVDFSSAGGHFNPTHANHGALDSKARHGGDLGNLMADNKGKANATLLVTGLTLKPGANSIIGKSVIIHQDKDDLKSQPAGNSGPRIACGVIEAL